MRSAVVVLLSLGLLSAALLAQGAGTRQKFGWDELQKQGRVSHGVVMPPEAGSPFHRLKIQNGREAATVTIWTIDRPPIGAPQYGLRGQVRYQDVEGTGYLELWSHFPGGGQYFSRTLADQGPMMKMHGSSDWRPFVLPFDATGAPPPTRLVLNVALPGRGRVEIGPFELTEEPAQLAQSDGLWTDRTAGMTGGVAGTLLGVFGSLIGVLTSLGRARRFVMALTTALIVVGVASLTAGLVSAAQSQPFAVSYPLLLCGLLSCLIPLGVLPTIRRRYAEIELRMMRAHDVA